MEIQNKRTTTTESEKAPFLLQLVPATLWTFQFKFKTEMWSSCIVSQDMNWKLRLSEIAKFKINFNRRQWMRKSHLTVSLLPHNYYYLSTLQIWTVLAQAVFLGLIEYFWVLLATIRKLVRLSSCVTLKTIWRLFMRHTWLKKGCGWMPQAWVGEEWRKTKLRWTFNNSRSLLVLATQKPDLTHEKKVNNHMGCCASTVLLSGRYPHQIYISDAFLTPANIPHSDCITQKLRV